MKPIRNLVLLIASISLSMTTAVGAQSTPSPSPAPSVSPSLGPNLVVVMVAGGTPVSVSFLEPVSSDKAVQGSQVAVEVAKEVDINGMMVIAKGAQGQATLTTVQHSGGNGSGGKIVFNIDWVYSVDGGKIALSAVNHATDNADSKGAASTLAVAGWLTFGLLGLFTHNLAHGKEALITSEKTFNVFVDHDVHVHTNRKAIAAPGFDS